MKIFPVVALCLLAALPWEMTSAAPGDLHTAISQIMDKNQGDLKMLKEVLWFAYGYLFLAGGTLYACHFVSKKKAARRERQAEKSRS
jgi:hypothetical protein